MKYNVMLTSGVTSEDVGSYNRTAVATEDIQNGTPLTLEFPEGVGNNVFKAKKATAEDKNIWFACSPEVNKRIVGEIYGGEDPRYFTNVAKKAFDVIKLEPNVDCITITKSAFVNSFDPDAVSGAKFVEIGDNGQYKAVVSETSSGSAIFNIIKKEPIIIANGDVGGEEVDAWMLEYIG